MEIASHYALIHATGNSSRQRNKLDHCQIPAYLFQLGIISEYSCEKNIVTVIV